MSGKHITGILASLKKSMAFPAFDKKLYYE